MLQYVGSTSSDDNRSHLNSSTFPAELLCTENVIFDMITELDCNKSLGPDDISARMLKGTATSVTPSLTCPFNLSLSSECFQMLGKWPGWFLYLNLLICLFPQTTDKFPFTPSLVKSWNVLSINTSFSICALLGQSLPSNGASFLADQPPCSPVTVTHNWLQQLDLGYDVCTVYFDLQNAFESVPHRPLLQKLLDIQLNPYIVQWVSSYLTNRSQLVVVEGTSSPVLPVLSGVPQGSVLGPLLFLIFINDVTTQVSSGSFLSLFADDMALYHTIHSTADFSIVQCDISSLSVWIKKHFLSLQPAKCHAMVLTRKRLPPPEEAFPTLYVEVIPLTYVNSVKYLGIPITSNLSWFQHISNLHLKVRHLVGMLYRKFIRMLKQAHCYSCTSRSSGLIWSTAQQCGIPTSS